MGLLGGGSAASGGLADSDYTAPGSVVAPGRASLLGSCTQLDVASLIGSKRWQPRTIATIHPTGGQATMWEGRKGGELVDCLADGSADLGIVRLEPLPRSGHLAGYRQIGSKSLGRRMPATTAPMAEPRESSVRRTRTRATLWCGANRADRLLSMTYAGEGQQSWAGVVEDDARFRRRLRAMYPRVAVLTAAEWHPGGHGWHVHAALTGYVPVMVLARCWGQGGVQVERFKKSGTGPVSARLVGRYVAKYLSKGMAGGERPRGSHAYEVTQGTQPLTIRLSGLDAAGVRAAVLALLGGPLSYEWCSDGTPGWRGPPTAFLST